MPYLQAAVIYRHAVAAGFPPDQAVTMTAIALAESGGDSHARNAAGEDSRGLWQVNLDAHPRYAGVDLYDPATNARAAYEIYRDAGSVRPWSVTHADRGSPYLDFLDEARVAAQLTGADPAAVASADRSALDVFMSSATAQEGDPYVWAAVADPADPDPDAFDCAELVAWAAARAGVELPSGSWLQYLELERQGALIPVEEAARTPGALLFRFSSEPVPGGDRPAGSHVAISMGDGRTIEAKGRAYGVVHDEVAGRDFEYAAVIPGISDAGGSWSAGLAIPTGTMFGGPDSDGDGLADSLEAAYGLDPTSVDTDADGASDGFELTQLGTDPTAADTDRDGLADTMEASFGTNPLLADSDGDGLADGEPPGAVDSDADRLSDRLELALGTDPSLADSDGDGVADRLEVDGGFDPLAATSSPFVGSVGGAAQAAPVGAPGGPGATGPADADPGESVGLGNGASG